MTEAHHDERRRSALGRWRSERGRVAYAAAYEAAMQLCPPALATDLPTAYGSVRCNTFEPRAAQVGWPLVLLPGRASGTPMWSANLHDLTHERRVHVIDTLGDAGMSRQNRRSLVRAGTYPGGSITAARIRLGQPELNSGRGRPPDTRAEGSAT